MANKTMHHLVIGDDTYEIVDQTARDKKVPMPLNGNVVDYGEAGYVLMTNGDGTTEWVEMGGGDIVRYNITNLLTNVSNSNSATSIREEQAYNATLSVAESASLDSVSVTMGGVNITATAYNTSSKVISIASVTGDVVITARASIVVTQPITWTGVGTENTASPVIDAREVDIRIEVPFVEGDANLASTTTAEAALAGLGVKLYNDAELTDYVGMFYFSTNEIKSSWTSSSLPNLYFDTDTLLEVHGYYAVLFANRRGGVFVSNAGATAYLNAHATSVTLVTPEPEEEISNAEATDRDLLQAYSLKAVSLNTDTADDATSYAGVIETAKNEWMREYSGSINKIPLIIHTDQHASMGDDASKTMWETIDDMVSWFDISKVVNLGDTTNSYSNYDDPTLGDAYLEAYLEATKAIPMSKRIEVFGNHDCMANINNYLTYVPTFPSYLNPYFKNVMARKTSNNGYHVTYDPYFNVKYIVTSNYDYVDASNYEMASPAQYDWVIEELSKDDGYDIIVLSHVGHSWYHDSQFSNILKARYAKTAGTATDRLGGTHSYDFTNCQTNLLVFLHGHNHDDHYDYDMGVLSQCFDNYYETTRPIFFVIVDRENNQLKVWKVTNTPEYTVYTRPFIEQT